MGHLSSDTGISLTGTIGTIAGLAVSCLAVWVAYQTMRCRGASRNDLEVRMVEFIATQIGINTPSDGLPFHVSQTTASFPNENLPQLPLTAHQNTIGHVQRRTEVLAPPQPSSLQHDDH